MPGPNRALGVLAALLGLAAPAEARQQASSFLRSGEDACACLNWRETYSSRKASCGQGHEFYMATKHGLPLKMAKKSMELWFCKFFYERLDDNACTNLDHANEPQKWSSGQWCYVSKQCKSAAPTNGTSKVRVKLCQQGQDKMLRDLAPAQLRAYALEHDVDTGLLAQRAYPVEKAATWNRAKALYGQQLDKGIVGLSIRAKARMQSIKDSGKPLVIDSGDDHPPFAVVAGPSAYMVESNMEHVQEKHPSSVTSWRCLQGCDQ